MNSRSSSHEHDTYTGDTIIAKVLVLYYSMYGHVETLAKAVSAGAGSVDGTELMNMSEITGGTPYGASTLAGADGSRQPSANELTIARFQGAHVAHVAKKLSD